MNSALKGVMSRQVIGIFMLSCITFILLFGAYLTFFPILLEASFNVSPLIIGLIMSTMSVITAITSSQMVRLTRKYSEINLIKIAFLLIAFALVTMPFIHHIWGFLFPIIIFGIAIGIKMPSLFTLLAGMSSNEHRAVFMSLNGMSLRLGQTLGPFLTGIIFAIWGIESIFFVSAVLSMAVFVFIIILVK